MPPERPAGQRTDALAQVFRYSGHQVRTLTIDGEPWFVAADLAAVLGYRDAYNASRLLDDDEKGTHQMSTPGGQQRVTVVSEPGLYTLIVRSDMPDARRFRKWVTGEVLPAIRRTGRYELQPSVELDELEVARRYVATLEAKKALEARVAALEPSAAAWDHLGSGDGDWAVGDAAKILSRDPNITIGSTRLFTQLYEWDWIFRAGDGRWRVKQTQVDLGRLSEIPQSHYHPRTGELVLDPPQVRIKPKGLAEIHRRMGGEGPFAYSGPLELTS